MTHPTPTRERVLRYCELLESSPAIYAADLRAILRALLDRAEKAEAERTSYEELNANLIGDLNKVRAERDALRKERDERAQQCKTLHCKISETVAAHNAALAQVVGLKTTLTLYRKAVKIDTQMNAPRFMGCNYGELHRAWKYDQAAMQTMEPDDTPATWGDGELFQVGDFRRARRVYDARDAALAQVEGLRSSLKEMIALATPNIYPQPDKPNSGWATLERARATLASTEEKK